MAPILSPFNSKPHMVLFPFMSKGHTIPLLHLARLLLHRGVRVTIFTTPANHPFIAHSLPETDSLSVLDLPFPENIPGIPPEIESTDRLPSMSLFIPFVNGTKLMQPFFEEALGNIQSDVTCVVSDGFLPWTLASASKFNIPRLSFYGMSDYALALSVDASVNGSLSLHESADEPFNLTSFPSITLTRNHFDEPFDKREPSGPHLDFIIEANTAAANSSGLLVNSFYELEKPYADYCKNRIGQKSWHVGPLCLAQPKKAKHFEKPKWMHWLDEKLAQGRPVLYVAFGSQAKLASAQLKEIAIGLEEANVNFFWVIKRNDVVEELGFEERVKERGIIVKEWVDQREILEHETVKGFLSHCGWNSVLEGICAEVPIVAWPMMAEQFLNAKMVAEEIKVGLRVNTVDGSAKGFVSKESLKNTVVEVMEGEKGKELREKVKDVAAAARKAMAEGGSSWHDLNQFITEMHGLKKKNSWNLS